MAATETTTRKFHFPSYLSLQGTRPPLSAEEVALIERYWRATNYLSVGQIYLLDNPLLTRSLKAEDVKPRLLGHFGTTPGLNFIYVHLNRVIKKGDLDMIYICGPGHGGPGMVANAYLESTYTEMFPSITEDEEGLRKLFKQFSFPGGIPSHAAPETPGSIHEGGELGYALSHAFGAAFDNPDLIVACVVGDGEAETGPLATSWHGTKFLNARRDGAVLPVLHLNGYKIANPAILARMSDGDLEELFHGHGYQPVFVEGGEDHAAMHQMMATALDWCVAEIKRIQAAARVPNAPASDQTSKRWPMIVLRSPKGWTGPASVGGKKCEDFWRSHQVPIAEVRTIPANVKLLEEWMLSYGPAELFGRDGKLLPELRALAPQGNRRMSANPHANGGLLTKDLKLPDFRNYRVELSEGPGAMFAESTRIAGKFLRDVMKLNPEIFRVFGPDETASNRLTAVLEATSRTWCQEIYPEDEGLALDGRVMEILSEHTCEGWLEGYLLTGRHGWFSTYEAFAHVVDSMVNQMAKWLKVTNGIVWRRPVPSLNILLTSHVWRQDHNGFSHQDPGFVDHVVNKKGEVTRVYFPPDANCLLNTVDHVLRSRQYINVIISGKQPQLQFLDMDAAEKHATLGLSIWPWASTDTGSEPDVVMVSCGDVPTLEALAATEILRRNFSALRIRFVNVMDLMRLQPKEEHPHGLDDKSFDSIFTKDKPVVFNFHGYPWLIHRLTYRRTNHRNIHVRGYKEEGTTTTPFDMCVLNDIDRFHLVEDVIDRVPGLMAHGGALVKQQMREKIIEHKLYIRRMGEDMPEIRNWRWSFGSPASPAAK